MYIIISFGRTARTASIDSLRFIAALARVGARQVDMEIGGEILQSLLVLEVEVPQQGVYMHTSRQVEVETVAEILDSGMYTIKSTSRKSFD